MELVEALRAFADNLDGTPATTGGKVTAKRTTKTAAAPIEAESGDDGFVTDNGGAEPDGFDSDDTASEANESDEADFKAKTAKPTGRQTKTKKLTLDDVNDACKAHAAVKGRDATLAILQKKFKTQTVTSIKPEQYEACISAMAVN